MQDHTRSDWTRLEREVSRRAHAERRSPLFTLTYALAHSMLALSPAFPGSQHYAGQLTVAKAVALLAPAFLMTLSSGVLYRLWGSESLAYKVSESLESFCQYGSMLAFIYGSELVASPLWVGLPFTAVFWATSYPFQARRYLFTLGIAHVMLATAYAARGDFHFALLVLVLAAALGVLLTSVARGGRRAILLEAERDIEELRFDEALLGEERGRIHAGLWESVGHEVQGLVDELERRRARHPEREPPAALGLARTALAELTQLSRRSVLAEPRTFASLATAIEEKCRVLCEEGGYRQDATAKDLARLVPGELARGLVQLAQEMVRNAVMHGRARHVCVVLGLDDCLVLTVRDDGQGLSEQAFANSSGGLRSAREWLRGSGGELELTDAPAGFRTELRASLPMQARRDPIRAA